MSSSAYITLDEPATLTAWQAFCAEHDIIHSPRTVGGNVFYRGEVEISVQGSPPLRADGLPDPVGYITVGTFFMGDVHSVAEVAATVWLRFRGAMGADPEVQHALVEDLRLRDSQIASR